MKIQEMQLIILEDPDQRNVSQTIVSVPGLFRTQYTHRGTQVAGHARQNFMKVITDEGIEGLCTTTMGHVQFDILRRHAIGQDPLHREYLFQMLPTKYSRRSSCIPSTAALNQFAHETFHIPLQGDTADRF